MVVCEERSGMHMGVWCGCGCLICGRVAGMRSVPLPVDALQGEGSAQVRGILDTLRRRLRENLAQH